MTAYDVDWCFALAALRYGHVVSRSDSVWKNQEMRLRSGKFEDRRYIEGILEHCEPHWTEWQNTDRYKFSANREAKDWIVREAR